MKLRDGEITIIGRITDASNATLLGEIEGSRVVYKPIAGERPLWDFPDGNLAQREYASFLVSEKLGLDIVPRTILREGPYGVGMVQEWCEPNPEVDVVEFSQSDSPVIRRMALFDILINNGDRKFGHILPIDLTQVRGCDHGVTFNEENRLRTVLWQWAGEKFTEVEIDLIHQFIKEIRSSDFAELLAEHEILAAIDRAEELLRSGVFPHPSDEWPAIPWPPF
jgi:uncharacterized repeat protein (TIGR03843 family)